MGPESVILEVLKSIGTPAATVTIWILIYHKWIAPKSNGRTNDEIKALTDSLAGEFKTMMQSADLHRTQHFDQLRRDLTTTIERQAQLSRDDQRNALSTLLMEMELGRLRGGDK